jgi:uncharacterized protein YdhG (YjbR/CyaY superfamily)
MIKKVYQNIDEYLADFPSDVVLILNELRAIVKEIAPEAIEVISYNMPAFKLNKKVLIYFAAYKNHIGFYALPSGNDAFKAELAKYHTGKGSIQFPLNEPMPYELIKQIIMFRVGELTMM